MTRGDGLTTTYDPAAIEGDLYNAWEAAGYFAPSGSGAPYCIMLPPPNVTGSLHMGHAFQDTIMDALVRYHRMRGDNSLWQCGTDHAGIATQMVVERQLEAEGRNRRDMGREAFVERIWQWKEQSGGTITRQMRRLGSSVDWQRERFTMDPELSEAVRDVFVRLHDEGLIYRGKRLVNWDPVLLTAISDLEVVSEEEDGHLWHMRYPLEDSNDFLVVATTRPETLLGDSAVAVHPEDERYRHLVGRYVILPLVDRRIPVIADDYVDPEFGSGCVKITPAHDFNDYEIWSRHKDELKNQPQGGLLNIFTPDGKIKSSPLDDFSWDHVASHSDHSELADEALAGPATTEQIPNRYQGLDRFEARKLIVRDLQQQNLLDRIEDHKLMIPRGDRSHTVVEPYLTDQWYVKIQPLADEAIRAVEDGRIRFVPENWTRTYFDWMNNIQDWCISRQLWWGHRIPAWYDTEGRVYVGASEAAVREKHGLGADIALRQDEDVLDTWFSSALWPFSTLGWPGKTPELATFYPGSVLVTGFDIIFFWVARMIMMGLKFTGDVPFREVYIHGLIRDSHGQKMSKSKGNVLDPLDLIDGIELEALVRKRTTGLMQPELAPRIEKMTREDFPDGIPAFGTDALRFTFASLATQGRDINFDLGRIDGYRNFCNKLWNAARFVLMNTRDQDCGLSGAVELGVAERWIISRLQQVEAQVAASIDGYRFDHVSQALYGFTWDEYCSWYLELSKVVLNDPETPAATARGTRRTLVRVLETLLRLLHPLMPFITEALWKDVAGLAGRDGETIMLQPWPVADPARIDDQAISEIEWLTGVISALRNIRGEMNLPPSRPLILQLQHASDNDRRLAQAFKPWLQKLGRVESVWIVPEGVPVADAASALLGDLKLLVPLGDLIDRDAERKRLGRELEKVGVDLQRATAKLANPNFVERAPAAVVEKERARAVELRQALEKLSEQMAKVAAL